MTNIDLIIMAFRSLTKRKIRTALTILSVVIGATSIIVMVSLGVALDEKFEEELKNMKNILFKTFEKTIIALILSTIVFLILGFMLEGPLTSSRYIITISDGILLGWIISLFNHIPNAK